MNGERRTVTQWPRRQKTEPRPKPGPRLSFLSYRHSGDPRKSPEYAPTVDQHLNDAQRTVNACYSYLAPLGCVRGQGISARCAAVYGAREQPRMTIAIVCAYYYCRDAYRRDITERIFRHYASVPDSIFIGVGSEGHVSREVLERANPEARYLEFDQDWDYVPPRGHDGLRRKYNFAIEAAREYSPTAVFALGSDDLVPHAFFTNLGDGKMLAGAATGEGSGAYFWPHMSRHALWWDGRSADGSARGSFCGGVLGFSPQLLDDLDWAPWRFEGDEVGIERYVRETYGADALDARTGVPSWHPKTTAVLNSMAALKQNLALRDVEPSVLKPFLDYWATLGPTT